MTFKIKFDINMIKRNLKISNARLCVLYNNWAIRASSTGPIVFLVALDIHTVHCSLYIRHDNVIVSITIHQVALC